MLSKSTKHETVIAGNLANANPYGVTLSEDFKLLVVRDAGNTFAGLGSEEQITKVSKHGELDDGSRVDIQGLIVKASEGKGVKILTVRFFV